MIAADEQLGRAIHRLTVADRKPQAPFPFTAGWVQAVARGLGRPVGEHRAARIVRRMVEKRVIEPVGSYRGRRHGFRVTLYRSVQKRRSRSKASVRRRRPVKPWWQHALFGFGCEAYAETRLPRTLRRWAAAKS